MICIGIRWCRIVPNGRESERERRVFVLFKIEGELKPRVPPPPLFYIHPTVPFFFSFSVGCRCWSVCVRPFFLLLCGWDPPLVLPWRYYFRPFHLVPLRVAHCVAVSVSCVTPTHTHSRRRRRRFIHPSIHFSIPPPSHFLVILYLESRAFMHMTN